MIKVVLAHSATSNGILCQNFLILISNISHRASTLDYPKNNAGFTDYSTAPALNAAIFTGNLTSKHRF